VIQSFQRTRVDASPALESSSAAKAIGAKKAGKSLPPGLSSFFSALLDAARAASARTAQARPSSSAQGATSPAHAAEAAASKAGASETLKRADAAGLALAGKAGNRGTAVRTGGGSVREGAEARTPPGKGIPVLAASTGTEPARKAAEAKNPRDAGADGQEDGSSSDLKSGRPARRAPKRDGSDGSAKVETDSLNAAAFVSRSVPQTKVSAPAPEEKQKAEGVEAKRKDRRKDRMDVEVYDYRARQPDPAKDPTLAESGGKTAGGKQGTETEMVLSLGSERGENGAESKAGQRAGGGASFSDALARELRANANSDIVKHAALVLRDGNEGLIRLSLKPESLGSVKIRLELADNKIAGRIIVESDEALKAFEKEIASLEQAFLDGGFDGASLELSVSSDGARGKGGFAEGRDGPKPFWSERVAATSYDAALPGAVPPAAARDAPLSLVNVLV